MAKFLKRFARAAKAAVGTQGEGRFLARGDPILCPVCSGHDFLEVTDRHVPKPLMMRWSVPWLKLDGFSTSLVCTHCTHMLSFARAPDRVQGRPSETISPG